ncbi:hypothetical protein FM105_04570 [Brevibacterium yomogidense]|uniref:Alpha-L-glutamate ligase-related protein ATP-grasp domain-containing protein n=2 Tax=Brevibacterium yomogidense TaxID=946573 RepID=A0A1X6X7L0_9MICO|nr:hypothetical protein FM105_04570 [Brevibacterium yomogidense]
MSMNPARAAIKRIRAPFGWAFRKYRAARVFQIALKKLWRKEMQWDVPFTMRRPRWWLKGFLSRSAVLYELEQGNDPNRYVSDVHRYFRTKNMVHARLQDIINNKLSTHLLLRSMDIRSPELIGVFSRGLVHFFPGEGRMSVVDYLESMEQAETVFFKVLAGAEGNNIHAVERTSDRTWAVDGVQRTKGSAASVFAVQPKPMIIERGLIQHPDQAALFADSVNTLRVLTMVDLENGNEPFIAMAVQRIGCRRSAPADNWTRGGLSARVDLETGRLGRATRLPDGDVKEWFDTHPDSGAQITGVSVPMWQEVHDLVLHSARSLSFMEYIGWDIVISPEGPVVLEANVNTGLNVMQSHAPLFDDPRVRNYYSKRGVKTRLLAEAPAENGDASVPVVEEV